MTVRYSDILTSFDSHPLTGDVGRITNADAVKRSVRNLVLTDKYERRLSPAIGSNIRSILFEPMDGRTAIQLRDYIDETVRNYEPRAILEGIVVEPDYDRQSYYVSIRFRIINIEEPVTLDFYLDRVR